MRIILQTTISLKHLKVQVLGCRYLPYMIFIFRILLDPDPQHSLERKMEFCSAEFYFCHKLFSWEADFLRKPPWNTSFWDGGVRNSTPTACLQPYSRQGWLFFSVCWILYASGQIRKHLQDLDKIGIKNEVFASKRKLYDNVMLCLKWFRNKLVQ